MKGETKIVILDLSSYYNQQREKEKTMSAKNTTMVFKTSEKETKQITKFPKKHRCSPKDRKKNPDHASKIFTYAFTITGIGVAVTMRCSCGKEKDVTDYDRW